MPLPSKRSRTGVPGPFSSIILDSNMLSLGWLGHCILIVSSFLAIFLESCKSKLCAASVVHLWFLLQLISVSVGSAVFFRNMFWTKHSLLITATTCMRIQTVTPSNIKHHVVPSEAYPVRLFTQNWGSCKLWQHQKSRKTQHHQENHLHLRHPNLRRHKCNVAVYVCMFSTLNVTCHCTHKHKYMLAFLLSILYYITIIYYHILSLLLSRMLLYICWLCCCYYYDGTYLQAIVASALIWHASQTPTLQTGSTPAGLLLWKLWRP